MAYIFNYPDDNGFVIISTSREINPILGFSNEGNFSLQNEVAKCNFVDKIHLYLEESSSKELYDSTNFDFDNCYVSFPAVKISLSQGNPWDKYVIQDYPNCPVGCVAVASAIVMMHSKEELNYHGTTYYFKSILDALKKGPNSASGNKKDNLYGLFPSPLVLTYTYDQAVDSVAKLLYLIGKDVNMNYKPGSSSANSNLAYKLCESIGFTISSGYTTYNLIEIINYLKNNHIIYLRGPDINGKGGHAWVVDGCQYCIDPNDDSQIFNCYIHCDWGWGGSCNGYFSGEVFEVSSYQFEPQNYFAVKME